MDISNCVWIIKHIGYSERYIWLLFGFSPDKELKHAIEFDDYWVPNEWFQSEIFTERIKFNSRQCMNMLDYHFNVNTQNSIFCEDREIDPYIIFGTYLPEKRDYKIISHEEITEIMKNTINAQKYKINPRLAKILSDYYFS